MVRMSVWPEGRWISLRFLVASASMALLVGAVAEVRGEGKELLAENGQKGLPAPVGIGVNYYHQEQGYDLKSLRVNVLPGDLAGLPGIEIDNAVTEMNLKLDYWLFPALNIFGIIGHVDGETDVDSTLIPRLKVEYEGIVYGGGVTVAGGYDRYFATLTAALTESDLDTTRSRVKAWIVSPKIGVASRLGAVWVGGMYQQTDERHEGRIVLPIYGDVDYTVEFEQKESWNTSAGITSGLGKHWQIDLEAGVGDRTHLSVAATYRF